jgi:hypothetical protein
VIWPGKREFEEHFRRRFLTLLEKAGRLSSSFHATLLSWRHSGFSVDASQRVAAGEDGRLERLARYATRVPLAVGALRDRPDGKVEIDTPPDPHTGARVKVMDRLDFIHAVCQQIPDRGLHVVRYRGAYANRLRRALREARAALAEEVAVKGGETSSHDASETPSVDAPAPATPGSAEARRRSSWARMLKKVFEVDPLLCPRCRSVEMEIVAWITEVDVVDRILRHRREKGLVSPFGP